MTSIIPPDVIPIIFGKANATGLINKTNAIATEEEARQQAQKYTKDIMQSYVARGQESHNFFFEFIYTGVLLLIQLTHVIT